MNLLLLNHYAGSPEMGMEFRPYYMAREWIKMGHSVRIVAGDFSHLRIRNPRISRDFEEQRIDGIHYVWLRTGDYKGNGARRAFTMFRFVGKLWLRASWIARQWKPDVVIASSTYPLDTYAAQRIAKKAGAKLIHEVHDMWPATLTELGGMKKSHPFVVLMQGAENSAYRNSDWIVSLPPYAKKYMMQHGMADGKFIHIPNGVSPGEWECQGALPEQHRAFFEACRKKASFIVGYFGGHALSNSLDALLDAAKAMEDARVRFVLVGKGVEKERLMKRKEEEKIDNLYFLPPVKKNMVPALLSCFDCIYMGAAKSPLYRFGLCMNKMFDSMMAGKPIVCAITTPPTVIEKYQAGLRTDSEDIEGIIQAIQEIKSMGKAEREKMGENGKNAILQYYTYDKLAAEFAALFEEN